MEQENETDDQEEFLFFANKANKLFECGVYWNKGNGKRRDVKGRERWEGRGRKLPTKRDGKKEEMKEKFFTE